MNQLIVSQEYRTERKEMPTTGNAANFGGIGNVNS
jgi:hypothetical protein